MRCDFFGEVHTNGECIPKGGSKEANYMGKYKKGNPYSNTYNLGWAQHPNLKYLNNNTLNTLIPSPQKHRKPLVLEESLTCFVKSAQNNHKP